jgi:flagellar biosynthesis GTPase FlhF
MVTTRAKAKSGDHESEVAEEPKTGQKRSRAQAPKRQPAEPKGKQHKKEQAEAESNAVAKKQKDDPENDAKDAASKPDASNTPRKKQKQTQTQNTSRNKKVESLIQQHPDLPLSDTDLEDPRKPTPDTLLALLLHAILSSTRVSHAIAAKTTSLVIKAGYHKLDILKKSTWQERTEVLTEGGYTHYR